jgi:hypothetical protein
MRMSEIFFLSKQPTMSALFVVLFSTIAQNHRGFQEDLICISYKDAVAIMASCKITATEGVKHLGMPQNRVAAITRYAIRISRYVYGLVCLFLFWAIFNHEVFNVILLGMARWLFIVD